ncbi:MAG: hypothetical protein HC827_07905 [Cyanobacteria bacterium RM1_2_2]|nr:hypothetical protein [Cyanobacteria bacterium RM1_2_2]
MASEPGQPFTRSLSKGETEVHIAVGASMALVEINAAGYRQQIHKPYWRTRRSISSAMHLKVKPDEIGDADGYWI